MAFLAPLFLLVGRFFGRNWEVLPPNCNYFRTSELLAVTFATFCHRRDLKTPKIHLRLAENRLVNHVGVIRTERRDLALRLVNEYLQVSLRVDGHHSAEYLREVEENHEQKEPRAVKLRQVDTVLNETLGGRLNAPLFITYHSLLYQLVSFAYQNIILHASIEL